MSLQLPEDQAEEQLQFSTPAVVPQAAPQIHDPPLMIALLCGGPTAGQARSLASAQMLLQQLQTHNPREGFQGDTAAAPPESASTPANGSEDASTSNGSFAADPANDPAANGSSNGSNHLPLLPASRREDLSGIHFVPIFISSGLQAMPITPAELCGKNAATLQFEADSGTREVLSLEQLGEKLQPVADVAMSTVPGTSLYLQEGAKHGRAC